MGTRVTYITVRQFRNRKNVCSVFPAVAYPVDCRYLIQYSRDSVANEEHVQPAEGTFRKLQHVTHQEAIGALDPFQRYEDIAVDAVGGLIRFYMTFGEVA
jgi:hypothetical protein